MRRHPNAYGVELLNKVGVPCGPINTIDQSFADPQVQHLGIARPVNHPKLEAQQFVGQPSIYPLPDELCPTPDQGEHTDAGLRELGYDAAAIACASAAQSEPMPATHPPAPACLIRGSRWVAAAAGCCLIAARSPNPGRQQS
jgi:crotonobetainyl-CoA:carnitine CoA-transferase CaiB-like acyl-CoA transferase